MKDKQNITDPTTGLHLGSPFPRVEETYYFRRNGRAAEIYRGTVMLSPGPSQRVFNHSPDGFNWGYGGSGPAQAALAVLLDYSGDRGLASRLHQDFKWVTVANMPFEGGTVRGDFIRDWLAAKVSFSNRLHNAAGRIEATS